MPSTAQCGSEQWFLTNSTLQPFIKGTCQNGVAFSSYSAVSCLCPAAVDISPCTCGFTNSQNTTVTIDCSNNNLTDTAMTEIMNKIYPWSPVDTIYFNGNNLTQIPAGLAKFTQLHWLEFQSNSITSIGLNDLSGLTAPVEEINLSTNQITTIADGAFPSSSSKFLIIFCISTNLFLFSYYLQLITVKSPLEFI